METHDVPETNRRYEAWAMDYALSALQLAAPAMLGLTGPATGLHYLFGGVTGVVSAVTDHRLAVKPLVSLRTHGQLEGPMLPAMLILPMVTGAMAKPTARNFFLTSFALAAANFLMTDFKADERMKRQSWRQVVDGGVTQAQRGRQAARQLQQQAGSTSAG